MSCGLALDIGTTNIAASLVDLETKKELAADSTLNSQGEHGKDVMTRLTYTLETGRVEELQRHAIEDINKLIGLLLAKAAIAKENIIKIVVVGNTCMLHFFFRLDPTGLATFPYYSKIKDSIHVKARDLGISVHKDGVVESLPVISPFLGADSVSDILYTDLDKSKEVKLLMDLGTNAEIFLGSSSGILGTSTAAGPAFSSSYLPLGSQLISAAARLLKQEQLNVKGILKVEAELFPEVTQEDIRALQVAKAAVRAGTHILMKRLGVEDKQIAEVLMAGIFGEKIEPQDALFIGLLPTIAKPKIKSLGNTALAGAKMVLAGEVKRERIREAVSKVTLIELSNEPEFQVKFIKYMDF